MKPLAVGALPTRPHAWSPTTSPARSAASQTLWWRGLPYGASVRTGSRTWMNPGCAPSRSISATAASGSSVGRTRLPRSRSSRSRNWLRIQSLTPAHSAAS